MRRQSSSESKGLRIQRGSFESVEIHARALSENRRPNKKTPAHRRMPKKPAAVAAMHWPESADAVGGAAKRWGRQWRAADQDCGSRCGRYGRSASGLGVVFVGVLCRYLDRKRPDAHGLPLEIECYICRGFAMIWRWAACGALHVIKFNRTAVTYDTLRKECLETIRHWPGCETVAGIQLIRENSPAGFSAKITLYGRADKKVANRVMICVQREKRRHYRLTE